MSNVLVDNIKNRAGGAVGAPSGAVVTGVITATSFVGDGGGLTGIDATTLKDSSDSVKVQGNTSGIVVTGVSTFTGNVSVGGVVTYEDVTSIDSVGVVTARAGIKVGAGQSISAVSGIVTYYGDGSKLSGVESGVVNFVASGTIPNGATVVINTDGTVGIVTQTGSATPSAGTPVVFESANTSYSSAAYDSNSGKVVIAYRDSANSEYGTAIVGTVSGTSISFGTAVVFNSGTTDGGNTIAFDSTNNKVVIAYRNTSSGSRLEAIVGTVSGTSISFGSALVVNANSCSNVTTVFDSTNGKIVIAWTDTNASSVGKAIVGTVSGTSISVGSFTTFNSGNTSHITTVFDSTNGKVVISYRDHGDSGKGKSIVGTVSGTSISFGSEVQFKGTGVYYLGSAYDSTNGKVVIAYTDDANSSIGRAIVGTVSGTSISFGTEVTYETGAVQSGTSPVATFDSTNGKVVIVYRDENNSNYGTALEGTVSGSSISFGTAVVFNSGTSTNFGATYDSSNKKVVIAYTDSGNSSYGTAVVFSSSSLATNLTSENYIGIAAEAIANGATGKVNVVTGTNTGQTGLTTAQKYFVQPTGTLGTSAGSPSVVAGTAISDTKIVVR